MRPVSTLLVSLLLLSTGCGDEGCGAGGCSSTAAPVDIRLQVDDFVAGLDKPWDLAWLPNGTLLVT